MHDVFTVGIPLLAILAGILFSRNDAKDLRAEMKDFRAEIRAEIKDLRTEVHAEIQDLRSEMKTRFDLVDAELRYFHGTVGKLEARIDAIEKRG
jgi:F0F1-type ATP synthase membrane subunit b/b'